MAANMITPMLFVTANVGSIFEEPKRMLQAWVTEFLKTVKRLQPQFIALHCQEIGGKNYEGSMKYVEDFVRMLMASEELVHFDRIRVFLDEDFASSERFTALGNLYFVHEAIRTAQIWDFKAKAFVPCNGKDVHSGNIEDVSAKEKVKYPPDFFPECKWSRKGFLRTRWNINGTLFDLINIHLFHDASNFLAIEAFPSIYSNHRHRALQHVIERLKNESDELLPFYVFGDFNFRLDTQGVVKKLTNKTIPQQVKSNKNGEISKLVYTEQNNEKVILTLGKKEFDHHEHHHNFFDNRGKWMREFDREVEPFNDQLSEFPISFPPSYPFCEDANSATSYMRTRCPAWCDRVLLSKDAKSLVTEMPSDKDNPAIQYSTIGEGICMGDHKPVFLFFWMATESGSPPTPLPVSPDANIPDCSRQVVSSANHDNDDDDRRRKENPLAPSSSSASDRTDVAQLDEPRNGTTTVAAANGNATSNDVQSRQVFTGRVNSGYGFSHIDPEKPFAPSESSLAQTNAQPLIPTPPDVVATRQSSIGIRQRLTNSMRMASRRRIQSSELANIENNNGGVVNGALQVATENDVAKRGCSWLRCAGSHQPEKGSQHFPVALLSSTNSGKKQPMSSSISSLSADGRHSPSTKNTCCSTNSCAVL